MTNEKAASLAAQGRKIGSAVLVGGGVWALLICTIMASIGDDLDRFLAIAILGTVVLAGAALTAGGRLASTDATPGRGCAVQIAGGVLLVLLSWAAIIGVIAQNIR